jgi:transposase
MPHDLPHWSTVYHYFRQWQKEGVWEKAVQALVRRDREREGRPASPSALVMDSQSVVTSEARILQTTEKGGPGETMGRKRSKGESARS